MIEGIPGSSPDWHASNMKSRGRALPAEIPPSVLGGSATGLAAWGSGTPEAQLHQHSRRHFHQSQLTQTTAYDCLPCVDAAHKQHTGAATSAAACTSSSSSSGSTEVSMSLKLANQAWKRHRRLVPPPPCKDRPQGKRMILTAAPSDTCQQLLQDPQPPQALSRPAAASPHPAPVAPQPTNVPPAAPAAFPASPPLLQQSRPAASNTAPLPATAAPCAGFGTGTGAPLVACGTITPKAAAAIAGHTCGLVAGVPQGTASGCLQHPGVTGTGSRQQDIQGPGAGGADIASVTGSTASGVRGSSAGSTAGPEAKAMAVQDAGKGGRRAARRAGRVEDNPDFFRTPKDPPTLQRFTASLAQLSVGKGHTAARHEAGIRSRQQAQLVTAAREVAALDAGAQQDVD